MVAKYGREVLKQTEEAARLAQLASGADTLFANLKNAVKEGDNQWALQLADALIALDEQPANAKLLKAEALKALAKEQINATARNYYLTVAHELESEIPA